MESISNLLKKKNFRHFTKEQTLVAQELKDIELARKNGTNHECPICRGVGQVRRDDGSGLTDPCECVNLFNLPWDDRRGITRDEALKLSLDIAREFNNHGPAVNAIKAALKDGHGWIYLYGDYGLGKTWILKSAIASALQANKEAIYLRMSTIVNQLNEALDPQASERESALMSWLVNIPVLAIDEIDKMRPTEYRIEKRFELLDGRYERTCNEKLYSVTIIAGNESPEKLDGYLFDRIRDGRFTIVELKGLSLRPGME